MSKPHICHLSLLNPLRHPRIYFKHAISERLAGYEVSVIAQGRGEAYEDEHGIHMQPLQVFSRLSAERLSRRQELYQMALELEADIYVLHSPELLGLAKKLKAQTGAKILYDVHEDYRINIRHANY